MRGTLELDGAGLRVRGFPHGLEDLRGTVRFTEAAAARSEASPVPSAAGRVELNGQAGYAARRLDVVRRAAAPAAA